MIIEDKVQMFLAKCRELDQSGGFKEIETIVAGGSVGRREHDNLSDLDLFLLIRDCDSTEFLRTKMRDVAGFFGKVLLYRGPVFAEDFGYSFTVLYEGLFICQFNVNDRTTLNPNPMRGLSSLVLFDRTGYYTDFMRSCIGLEVDEKKVFITAFSFFWLRSICLWKDMKRGQLWLAISHLSDLRDQMFVLRRLTTKQTPPGLNYHIPSKALEKDLGQKDAAIFAQSLCTYSQQSIVDAFLFCIRWFLDEARRYIALNNFGLEDELAFAEDIESQLTRDLTLRGE